MKGKRRKTFVKIASAAFLTILVTLIALLAGALPVSAAVFKVSQSEPDAMVKGLWLKCPGFPKDAELVDFINDEEWDVVEYIRSVDGLLWFTLRRQPIEESRLLSPDDVQRSIEMRVHHDDGDADSIYVDTDASEFAEKFSYPCVTAEYKTGQNEDTKLNMSLFIFTDVYCFLAEASIAADWAEDYEDRLSDWLAGLELVEK